MIEKERDYCRKCDKWYYKGAAHTCVLDTPTTDAQIEALLADIYMAGREDKAYRVDSRVLNSATAGANTKLQALLLDAQILLLNEFYEIPALALPKALLDRLEVLTAHRKALGGES